jgi:hypothetical protein
MDENPAAPENKPAGSQNERSTIEFPYTDLENAVEIVRGVHEVGGTACDYDQLAAHMKLEAKGGGFRIRVNGAKTYDLITYERGGRITLTELGRRVIDPQSERPAKVDAFLAVPLYSKVFDEFKGRPLPPPSALERALVNFGVGSKVAEKARQALVRSAKQSGFFDLSADRLTLPPNRNGNTSSRNASEAENADSQQPPPKQPQGTALDSLHPLIHGLLLTLPQPNTSWAVSDRLNWLVMANSIFKMIYPNSEGGDVSISLQ